MTVEYHQVFFTEWHQSFKINDIATISSGKFRVMYSFFFILDTGEVNVYDVTEQKTSCCTSVLSYTPFFILPRMVMYLRALGCKVQTRKIQGGPGLEKCEVKTAALTVPLTFPEVTVKTKKEKR